LGQGVLLGVGQGLGAAQGVDQFLGQLQFLGGDLGVTGDAEAATAIGGRGDLADFPFGGGQAVATVGGADDLVGFQGCRGVGQDAQQVGQEAAGFFGVAQAFLGLGGGGFDGLDGKAAHGVGSELGLDLFILWSLVLIANDYKRIKLFRIG